VSGNHLQAGGAAVHGVVLMGEGKGHFLYLLFRAIIDS
jgi:hypothetical protein